MRWMKFKLKNNNHWVTFSTKSIPPTQHTPPPCRKRCMNYKFIGVFVSVFPQLRDADNGIRTFFGVINQFSFVRNDLHASGTCRIACTLFVRLRICKLGMHSKLQLWRPNDAYLSAIFSTMGERARTERTSKMIEPRAYNLTDLADRWFSISCIHTVKVL